MTFIPSKQSGAGLLRLLPKETLKIGPNENIRGVELLAAALLFGYQVVLYLFSTESRGQGRRGLWTASAGTCAERPRVSEG